MSLKLGKLPAKPRPKDLELAKYQALVLPTPPRKFGFGKLYPDGESGWKMLANGPDDSVTVGFQGAGDCVFAGAAHETMVWNKVRHGHDVPFDGRVVLSDYSALTGYVIGDDSTDNGTDMHDAANYRRGTGIVDSNAIRHKVAAFAFLRPGDFKQAIEACYIFGGVGIGFEFPNSAWDQFDQGKPWDDVGDDQIDGGHYTPGEGSTLSGSQIAVVTWGKRQLMTKSFYERYVDEAVVYLSEEMIRSDGTGLHGFNLTQFKADLAAI